MTVFIQSMIVAALVLAAVVYLVLRQIRRNRNGVACAACPAAKVMAEAAKKQGRNPIVG